MPHLLIRFFLIQQELYSSFLHPCSDEAESHVRDDAYAMLQVMLLVCSVDMEIVILAVDTLQCYLRKSCNDRKGNRYNLLRSTSQLYISSKQNLWSNILLFGVLSAIVALLSLQKTLLCKSINDIAIGIQQYIRSAMTVILRLNTISTH